MGFFEKMGDSAAKAMLATMRYRPGMLKSKKMINRQVSNWKMVQIMKRSVGKPFLRTMSKPVWANPGLQNSFIPVGENVEIPPSVIPPREVVHDFLSRASYLVLVDECVCRVGGKCKNFPIEVGSIFMGEGARDLHPSMGHEVTVEEAMKHVDHALDIGLVPMIGHLMVDSTLFGMPKFDRFLTLCLCCECCCVFLKNWRAIRERYPDSLMPVDGVSVKVTDKCNGCGVCVPICPVEDIKLTDKKAVIGDLCIGCGCCANACPQNTIKVSIAPDSKVLEELRSRVESHTRID